MSSVVLSTRSRLLTLLGMLAMECRWFVYNFLSCGMLLRVGGVLRRLCCTRLDRTVAAAVGGGQCTKILHVPISNGRELSTHIRIFTNQGGPCKLHVCY